MRIRYVAHLIWVLFTSCVGQPGTKYASKTDKFSDMKNFIVNLKNQKKDGSSEPFNLLSEFDAYIIENKGTERAFTGEYYAHKAQGVYLCKRCDAPLYTSDSKFESHCGWPSFDNEILGAVNRKADADGRRTEIICNNCSGHLGHVFLGEGFTETNTRHCVNSSSLQFVPLRNSEEENYLSKTDTATFGAGCFWCVEAIFQDLKGVKKVESGYSGGKLKNPTYKEVCSGNTGHVEVAQVVFDPATISYAQLVDIFFHTHNPTTLNKQGADEGTQYRSVIFFNSPHQKVQAEEVLNEVRNARLWEDDIVTNIEALMNYYPAEDYHQNYFKNNPTQGYCSFVIAPKVAKFRKKYASLLKD